MQSCCSRTENLTFSRCSLVQPAFNCISILTLIPWENGKKKEKKKLAKTATLLHDIKKDHMQFPAAYALLRIQKHPHYKLS